MFLIMFAIHDSAAKAYISPFALPHPDLAKRTFANCAQDPNHQFNKYAADFTLFAIGHFDTDTGIIEPYTTHENLGKALDFKHAYDQPVPAVDLREATSELITEIREELASPEHVDHIDALKGL